MEKLGDRGCGTILDSMEHWLMFEGEKGGRIEGQHRETANSGSLWEFTGGPKYRGLEDRVLAKVEDGSVNKAKQKEPSKSFYLPLSPLHLLVLLISGNSFARRMLRSFTGRPGTHLSIAYRTESWSCVGTGPSASKHYPI